MFEDYLIKISGISLFVVMILTSFQIISRVLGYPWPDIGIIRTINFNFCFLGVAYAQSDAHIRMELLVGNLKGRAKGYLNFFYNLFILSCFNINLL